VFGLSGTAQAYGEQIGINLALGTVALLIFCLQPPARRGAYLALVPVALAVLGVSAVFAGTQGYTREFPSPFASYLNVYRLATSGPGLPIRDVAADAKPSPALRKIVLVIDESVRGDALSLNDPSLDTTPFLASRKSEIANFGIAAATANCSHEARMTMRFGLQEADIAKTGRLEFPGPTVWQYARRAGLKTVYIDSFGAPTRLTHGMTNEELGFVDRRVIIDDLPQYQRDLHAARQLRELLADPAPMFILVEKYGVHVPYNAQYPASADVFHAPHDRVFDLADRPNLLAQYRNAIRWSVDGFFSTLLKEPLPSGTLVIYTSDHGQSLSENTTRQTHCSVGRRAIPQEADVPLFAISSEPAWRAAMSRAASDNRGRASVFDVFPTLLAAMGYDGFWIAGHFGYTLIQPVPQGRRRFFWAMDSLRAFDGEN
jgi:lipid A ethanolaminephosphotransferase